MEPFEIDDIIRNKVNQASKRDSSESNKAKPFVWASVRSNLDHRSGLRWYHLAAAVVLLLLSFAFLEIRSQKQHQQEMASLSQQIEELRNTYEGQLAVITEKEAEVLVLRSDLHSLEQQLENLETTSEPQIQERILVKTDTVYVKQVEYIQLASIEAEPKLLDESLPDTSATEEDSIANKTEKSKTTDSEIFPSLAQKQAIEDEEESVKFRFGSFVTKTN